MFWEVDILGVDFLGVDILGVDILGVDILGRTHNIALSHSMMLNTADCKRLVTS